MPKKEGTPLESTQDDHEIESAMTAEPVDPDEAESEETDSEEIDEESSPQPPAKSKISVVWGGVKTFFCGIGALCCAPEPEPASDVENQSTTQEDKKRKYQECTNDSRIFNHLTWHATSSLTILGSAASPLINPDYEALYNGLTLGISGSAKIIANLGNLIYHGNRSQQTLVGLGLGGMELALGVSMAGLSFSQEDVVINALRAVSSIMLSAEATFYAYHLVRNSSVSSPMAALKMK